MRWDSSREVPWQRLIREWLAYVGIMVVVLVVFFRNSGLSGALAGLLVSGPLYLTYGFVMAKFGYQRRSLKSTNTPRARDATTDGGDDSSAHTVRRPAPTRRTSGGGARPSSKQRRR